MKDVQRFYEAAMLAVNGTKHLLAPIGLPPGMLPDAAALKTLYPWLPTADMRAPFSNVAPFVRRAEPALHVHIDVHLDAEATRAVLAVGEPAE